jgi:hypothetical protein
VTHDRQAEESPSSPQPAMQLGRNSGGAPQSLTNFAQSASQVDWMVYPGARGRSGVALAFELVMTHSKLAGHSELVEQGVALPPLPPSSLQAAMRAMTKEVEMRREMSFMRSGSFGDDVRSRFLGETSFRRLPLSCSRVQHLRTTQRQDSLETCGPQGRDKVAGCRENKALDPLLHGVYRRRLLRRGPPIFLAPRRIHPGHFQATGRS